MMKTSIITALLLFLLIISCSENNEGPANGKELNADPSKNQMLFTTRYEYLYSLDPETGESTLLNQLSNNNYLANVLEYHDGVLYGVTESNGLYAFDSQTGEIKWKRGLPKFDMSGVQKTDPVYHEGNIYVAGLYGIMIAFDAESGDVIWQFDFKVESDSYQNMYGRPTLYGDYLVYGTKSGIRDNYLVCLNNKTGAFQWVKKLEGDGVRGEIVAISDDMVFVPGENFEARSLETGNLLWEFTVRDIDGASRPVIAGDKVLFNGAVEDDPFYARLYCLDKNTGELIWDVDAGYNDAVEVGPKVAGDFVFGFSDPSDRNAQFNATPFAVSLETGEKIWENQDITVRSMMTYANGRLYIPGFYDGDDENVGGIICLDAQTGKFLWENGEAYYSFGDLAPIVVAENGVFKP